MQKNKKRLLWAFILLLLFLPPCYYFRSSFLGQKAQLERERLLVRKQISKPLQPTQEEGDEIISDQGKEELSPVYLETPGTEPDIASLKDTGEGDVSEPTARAIPIPQTPKGEVRDARLKDLESTIRKLKQELMERDGRIKQWKRRWEEKGRELERYKRELMALKKETIARERRLLAQKPPIREGERAKPEGKERERTRPEKPVGPSRLTECEGVPISHSNVALFFSSGLNLGGDLSYGEAVMALRGLGISPRAGWNQGDPSFPIGADELEEVLFDVEKAISMGLVAGDYSDLTNRLRHYCQRERAQLVETPLCKGPVVTECEKCEISHGEFAIYLCKVLDLGEGLNYDQSFFALAALRISPKRGWNVENPSTLVTQREMEEVRCSVLEAHKKGLIQTTPNFMVASINDYCLWLKMNVEVVGRGTVAEAVAQTDYQGGGRISIPRGGTVASSSE
jgi:hypothetical protein